MDRSAPNVLWAQRKNTLLLTVQLVDCPDPVIDLCPEGKVDYQGVKQSDSTVHGFDLELFGGINPEETKISKTLRNTFLVIKKSEEGHWPRLLKAKGKTPNFLKLDFDKWVDEDDEEDEGNEKHLSLPMEDWQRTQKVPEEEDEEDSLSDLSDLEPGPYDTLKTDPTPLVTLLETL
mmetsp:Transcript_18323/g.30782  ORF Transcript_18323/g.30782 Transcript_18323/m.30782 type:complete len:176 (+) Transcript_18323:233-760(+)|eukprot:CAMPEP_0198199038 /NCGR_PEP_ID=MMETSP1445-20131203/2375_1 /TAXON_ID=36898 /ORGANISM="Pyramimonas sp., Strain CCMP2087" /LENGTH=175 /DNA_ID=CAMNT_0043868747 /DNA_START=231 /DNA_END=758 /DNA_ORIENTATION=-